MDDAEFKKRVTVIAEKRAAGVAEEAARKQQERESRARRADVFRRLREGVIGPALAEAAKLLKESDMQAQANPYDPNSDAASIALLSMPGTPTLYFGLTRTGDFVSIYESSGSHIGPRTDAPFEKVTEEFVKEEVLRFVEANAE
jgi:hypothetical protein